VDDFTLDKVRLDYARVLISTTSLEILNAEAKVMVDGELFEFNIIAEWGFAIGEEACLGNDDESHNDDVSQHVGRLDDVAVNGEVEVLLNDISNNWNKEVSADGINKNEDPHSIQKEVSTSVSKVGAEPINLENVHVPQAETAELVHLKAPTVSIVPQEADIQPLPVVSKPSLTFAALDNNLIKDIGAQSRHVISGETRPIKRTLSCPRVVLIP
jgi:PAB1-binding protein PBP1